MLMRAVPAAWPLAQAVESMTAECCSTQAGLLVPSDSMATVVAPAALTAPIPRASAQRGTRSNMLVALPFSGIAPIRLCGDAPTRSVSGFGDQCFGRFERVVEPKGLSFPALKTDLMGRELVRTGETRAPIPHPPGPCGPDPSVECR